MFDQVFRRIEGFFKSLFSRVSVRFSKIKRLPLLIGKKAKDILKGIVDFIVNKPSQLSDYVRIGGAYVAKRALLGTILAVAVIIMLVVWLVIPCLSRTFFTVKLVVNTPEFHTASGNAEVYTENGELLYRGKLENGAAQGDGRLYDGFLVYQGKFAANEYEGNGKLYCAEDILLYEGEFSKSLYNGSGKLYYPNGQLKVSGTFVAGKLEGESTIYDENGMILYSGNISADNYNGKGTLYQNGELYYQGDFLNSEMTGTGTLYSNGEILYTGGIVKGVYNGSGTLYKNKDGMRVEGEFKDGAANGTASVYAPNGECLYTGVMVDGEISYISYVSSTRALVEQCFTENAAVRSIGDMEMLYYSALGTGFLFDADGRIDRILFNGNQKLYGVSAGVNSNTLQLPAGWGRYSEYEYIPTSTEKVIMNYLGENASDRLTSVKYINDSMFIKLCCSNGKVLFYEIGAV